MMTIKDDLELLELFFNGGSIVAYKNSFHQGDFWHPTTKELDVNEVTPLLLKQGDSVWLHNHYYKVDEPVTLQFCNPNQILTTYNVSLVGQHYLN